MKTIINTMAIVLVMVLATACHEDYSPRPRGYFRIDMPQKSYNKFDTTLPYKFEYPVYATITGDPYAPDQKNWINVNFPSFKAVLHLSYEPVNNNLDQYLNDAHTLVSKHIPKAEAIYDSLIYHPEKKIYGLDCLGSYEDLPELIRAYAVEEIIIAIAIRCKYIGQLVIYASIQTNNI